MILPAASILALTVGLALARPRVGRHDILPHHAALLGALLTVVFGLVDGEQVVETLQRLSLPLLTIVSLMVMTIVAERARLVESLAVAVARSAGGSGRRLFVLLFACGALAGTVFTNDAAVLIFTPLVIALVADVREESWTFDNEVPFYFAVLYVGNLVGLLVISNPINIVLAGMFDIGFAEYVMWMALPALLSMAVTLAGLFLFFRRSIPVRCRTLAGVRIEMDARLATPCLWLLGATLVGFFSESWTGIPVWLVAAVGAAILLAIAAAQGHAPGRILGGVGWDVLVFVAGIFIVVRGLRNVGLTRILGAAITGLAGQTLEAMSMVTALVAATCSSLVNNHPTTGLMIWVIKDFERSDFDTKILAYAALIGGDLGPKMLPIGSLAALLWFGILRRNGVVIPYSLYVKVGVPVTIAAVVASVLALNLEVWLAG